MFCLWRESSPRIGSWLRCLLVHQAAPSPLPVGSPAIRPEPNHGYERPLLRLRARKADAATLRSLRFGLLRIWPAANLATRRDVRSHFAISQLTHRFLLLWALTGKKFIRPRVIRAVRSACARHSPRSIPAACEGDSRARIE